VLNSPDYSQWLKGCLLGIAIADALGLPYEGLRPIELPLGGVLLRNLVFLAIILAHGFRRLVPF
jgi:hypothetical protein